MKKGPFKMKGFSGFGSESPAKHNNELQKSLRKTRPQRNSGIKPVSMDIRMDQETSNRNRVRGGMQPLFTGASNYQKMYDKFYNRNF